MRKIILGIFVIVILLSATESYAQCDCNNAGVTEAEEIKRSDKAFIGKVIKVKEVEFKESGEDKAFEVTFEVEKSLKNDSLKIVKIMNIASEKAHFEEKESYLVLAIKDKDVLFAWIGCCTRTRKF
jgi:hypothetical protein